MELYFFFYYQLWGNYVIFGDFNVVRSVEERFGSVFCSSSTGDFNDCVDDEGCGCAYDWEEVY